MTWWLVTIRPSGATMTPEPSEFWMRSLGWPKGAASPKNCRKNGSLNSRFWVRTTRRVNTLTTAGAALRTTGANDSWTCSRLWGSARGAGATAGAGCARAGAAARIRETARMRGPIGTGTGESPGGVALWARFPHRYP